jgi:recombination protein RecA
MRKLGEWDKTHSPFFYGEQCMAKKFDLEAYKKTIEANNIPKKKDKYVVLDECIQAVIGIPGVPLGHITQIFGKSDTGKTSLLFHAAAQAQKQGILPVFLITEGKIDWTRAERMGVDLEQCIKKEDCNFLENAFEFIDKILADVGNGNLPNDVLILWDSIGSTPSKDEVRENDDGTTEKKASMMRAAKCIRENIRVLNRKINMTRNYTSPNYVGLMVLNQAYTQPPTFPGGMSKLVPYGGDAVWYAASAVWKMSGKGRLSATKNSVDFDFGLVSKLSVEKNHITDLNLEGEFVITADAFIPNEKSAIAEYKKENKDKWGESPIFDPDTGIVIQ